MWDKPKELTDYQGKGFEIGSRAYAGASLDVHLTGWQSSAGGNRVRGGNQSDPRGNRESAMVLPINGTARECSASKGGIQRPVAAEDKGSAARRIPAGWRGRSTAILASPGISIQFADDSATRICSSRIKRNL
jgi:hypothetical protein